MSTFDDMNAEQDAAFREWQSLAFKALETKSQADAHAAGKAFGRFFYSYVENTHRPSAKVIPLPRRTFDVGGAA
jgi:hypothetical protein